MSLRAPSFRDVRQAFRRVRQAFADVRQEKNKKRRKHATTFAGPPTGVHLASLLEVAQTQPVVTPVEVKDDGRTAAITDLYVWLRDWRETARAVIKNRAQLISLGIGKRHAKKTAAATPPSPVTIYADRFCAARDCASAARRFHGCESHEQSCVTLRCWAVPRGNELRGEVEELIEAPSASFALCSLVRARIHDARRVRIAHRERRRRR